jgi:cytosine/uracil/thiamine/allantoin permease
VIPVLKPLYDYAWFVGFGVAFVLHVVLMRTARREEPATAAA